MNETPAQRALAASTAALAVAGGCGLLFLPPMLERTLESIPRTVLTGIVLGVAILLHWAYLGIAARRMQRSVGGWVGLSVLLFPVGSMAALMLLAWFGSEAAGHSPTAQT